MIKAVFFDLDGTLFDRDTTVRRLLEQQYMAFASQLRGIAAQEFVTTVISLDAHGYRNKTEVYATLCEECGVSPAVGRSLTADFWRRYHSDCTPFPGLLETLQELRHRGKALGIVTNGTNSIQDGVIDALAIRGLMDAILVSEAEGVRKPEPEIFNRAAARVRVPIGECCYVGDHPDIDVAGAAAAGMRSVWKRTPYWTQPVDSVATIDSLAEILSLV